LHAAQAEQDRLDISVAAGSSTPGSSQPASAADTDPQLKDLSDQLAAATESLTQSRVAHSSAADEANKALDQALANFRERINAAQGSLKDGSQLSAYLIAAQQAQDTIRQLNADLVERQKSEQQRLADLRRVLAEKQETRLKAAWAADSQLQQMDQDLSVAEHRYNAAVGSGLDADAATLKTEVETLKNQIDARRDLIGTGDIYADEVKSLQQFIDDSLKGMETDRARADMRMGEMLKALAAAAPQMEKLPADQQALEESLNKQLDEINTARQLQAQAVAAANPEADATVKKLEDSITELQAKMDARRKQLAEDNHKQLTTQQAQERATALEKAKADLTATQMEEADASASVQANKQQTDAAYSSVEALKAKAANLAADTARLSYLQAQLPDLKSQSEQLLATWQRIPVPQAPGDDPASAQEVRDPRLQLILISMLGYALLTAGMLAVWGVSHRQYHLRLTSPHDEEVELPEEIGLSDHADTLEPRGPAHAQESADD
jgi:chromosome segregation ATPase